MLERDNGEQIHYGADSSVSIVPWSPTVIKRYHKLSEWDLRRYTALHFLLSQEWWRIECSDKLRDSCWVPLQGIEFKFLNLWNNIVSTWDSVLHKVPHIFWDTLDDGLHKYFQQYDILLIHSHLIPWIEQTISEFMAKKLWIKTYITYDTAAPHVIRCNIKIVSFECNVLSLLITDIWASIAALLEENKKAIDRILQTQS